MWERDETGGSEAVLKCNVVMLNYVMISSLSLCNSVSRPFSVLFLLVCPFSCVFRVLLICDFFVDVIIFCFF